jgi:hypothetical protein
VAKPIVRTRIRSSIGMFTSARAGGDAVERGLERLVIDDENNNNNASTPPRPQKGGDGSPRKYETPPVLGTSPGRSTEFASSGSPSKYFSRMLEANCSAGKARRGLNGGYATKTDERVSMCGGNREPFLIGVAGGTASGKTTVCDLIMQNLQEQRVVLIAQDSFYRPLTQEEHDNVANYNFDHPDAIDTKYLVEVLQKLMLRQSVHIPVYDFVTHSRSSETIFIESGDVC